VAEIRGRGGVVGAARKHDGKGIASHWWWRRMVRITDLGFRGCWSLIFSVNIGGI
jgi:hypothetical protein